MKPTTLSFLVCGTLAKSSPIHSHNCTSQMLTNNASSFLPSFPIHSHNCTSQMLTNYASSLLLPIHSVHLQQHLVATTALNEIVISKYEGKQVASCNAQDFKTHCGLGKG
jgi:hypothetical protein